MTASKKIKQDRQIEVENDKKWVEMDDENDELIGRLKRLKQVELVEEPESEIYEILKMEEEIERLKDEYFEEKERQDQLNRIEPDKSDPEYKFEELNNYANELLLNRKRMKKQEFIKKLDIYMIIMRKKLINEPEKCKRMIEKKFINEDLEIELTSFIDDKQNIWFRGKDVAKILGYRDTDDALRRHVAKKYKIKCPQTSPGETPGQVRWYTHLHAASA